MELMKRTSPRTVADLMTTAVVFAKETDSLEKVEHDMAMIEIRHMPVVDAEGHVSGVVSHRDVLRALGKGHGPETPVGAVMTRPVYAARRETLAQKALSAMLERRIGCLPVTGEAGELVGIVTETDFLRIAAEALREEEA